MFGQRSSAYLRIPFTVGPTGRFENLRLKMRYDDGFVAWLNGVRVASANAPQSLAWNALAVTNRFPSRRRAGSGVRSQCGTRI
jgi:hypothetical protein